MCTHARLRPSLLTAGALTAALALIVPLGACGGSLFCGGYGEQDEGGEGGGGGRCGGGGAYAATPPSGVPSGAACSTGMFWQGGNEGTTAMHPGVDCITCHSGGEGPRYFIAGTIMGAVDDADDCQGVSAVTVQITDADGAVHETTTNSAGNFFFNSSLPVPYTVSLVRDGNTVSMLTPQSTGDCLSCHTAQGAGGAPGRIVAP